MIANNLDGLKARKKINLKHEKTADGTNWTKRHAQPIQLVWNFYKHRCKGERSPPDVKKKIKEKIGWWALLLTVCAVKISPLLSAIPLFVLENFITIVITLLVTTKDSVQSLV